MNILKEMATSLQRSWKEIDNVNSYTVEELMNETGLSEPTIRRLAQRKVAEGVWEQVWKQLSPRKKAAMSWRPIKRK